VGFEETVILLWVTDCFTGGYVFKSNLSYNYIDINNLFYYGLRGAIKGENLLYSSLVAMRIVISSPTMIIE
jgi:hypothetical protein